ncbi:hypothetical protein M885DRAFT_75062 [Pelagophyceae sp. CCMP2097]|nr:hypothetical protein M885DRAFT_75062 [Pelagophyceae sp. CCMP2097]
MPTASTRPMRSWMRCTIRPSSPPPPCGAAMRRCRGEAYHTADPHEAPAADARRFCGVHEAPALAADWAYNARRTSAQSSLDESVQGDYIDGPDTARAPCDHGDDGFDDGAFDGARNALRGGAWRRASLRGASSLIQPGKLLENDPPQQSFEAFEAFSRDFVRESRRHAKLTSAD